MSPLFFYLALWWPALVFPYWPAIPQNLRKTKADQ